MGERQREDQASVYNFAYVSHRYTQVVLDDSEFHIYHGFGLDVHSGFLYWSDWYEGAVFRAETDGTNQKKISMDLRDPKGLVFVNPDRPGGGCSFRYQKPGN